MTVKVLYIDDEIGKPRRDAQQIKSLLEMSNELECDLQPPPKNIFDSPAVMPDALLVDLDLSAAKVDGMSISYFGSTLAAEMRMRHSQCPIILITRAYIIGRNRQWLEESGDVDLILDKDAINSNPDRARADIVALVKGFEDLRTVEGKGWKHVVDLFQADGDEIKLIQEAAPPLDHGSWNIPQMARWIRSVVMGFPGILYDELTAATRLGISLESFRKGSLQEFLKGSKYTGLFSSLSDRWWRDRLFKAAQSVLLEQRLTGPMFQKCAEAFTARFKEDFEQAICVYDGTPVADWVCYILRQPVKQRNSIPYYPDGRPAVMDQARVSFKAIRESNDFDENLVDSDSLQIVRELWE